MRILILYLTLATLFQACNKPAPEQELTETEKNYFRKQGDTLTSAAFAAIRGQLVNQLSKHGVAGALAYCQVNAIPITDSIAQGHDVKIRRVSNRNRNPVNKADKLEQFLIKGYENDLHEKKNPEPRLVVKGDSVLYYKPILIQPLCLQCHGVVGQQITEEHAALIQKLYPLDKAINYRLNDIRGLWQVIFIRPTPAPAAP
ncbi:MAG: DUF3365 domain-containing protein [Cyclobacteriaceae bacterium]